MVRCGVVLQGVPNHGLRQSYKEQELTRTCKNYCCLFQQVLCRLFADRYHFFQRFNATEIWDWVLFNKRKGKEELSVIIKFKIKFKFKFKYFKYLSQPHSSKFGGRVMYVCQVTYLPLRLFTLQYQIGTSFQICLLVWKSFVGLAPDPNFSAINRSSLLPFSQLKVPTLLASKSKYADTVISNYLSLFIKLKLVQLFSKKG